MDTSVANLPLYLQPWWWNAATGSPDNWQAARIISPEGKLLAYWPCYRRRRFGFLNIYTPPPLCMHSGPWLRPAETESNPAKSLSRAWRLVNELLEQLPKAHYWRTKAPYSFDNGMALQRAGWRQVVKYSYQLPTQSFVTEEEISSRFAPHARQQLKKAASILTIREAPTVELQISLILKAFQAKGERKSRFPIAAFRRVCQAAAQNNAAVSWQAMDAENRVHATLWLAFDQERAYAILPAADPELRTSGAMSLLFWQGIRWAQQQGLIFDFEGSAIPGVEEFYRGFGPEPVPYYVFRKGLPGL